MPPLRLRRGARRPGCGTALRRGDRCAERVDQGRGHRLAAAIGPVGKRHGYDGAANTTLLRRRIRRQAPANAARPDLLGRAQPGDKLESYWATADPGSALS